MINDAHLIFEINKKVSQFDVLIHKWTQPTCTLSFILHNLFFPTSNYLKKRLEIHHADFLLK